MHPKGIYARKHPRYGIQPFLIPTRYDHDITALSYLAWTLWALGYTEQAAAAVVRAERQESIAVRALSKSLM